MGLKERFTGVKENFTGAVNRISGKSVEEKISEYTEIYGEILLGMNRELETSRRLISEYREEMSQLTDTTKGLSA